MQHFEASLMQKAGTPEAFRRSSMRRMTCRACTRSTAWLRGWYAKLKLFSKRPVTGSRPDSFMSSCNNLHEMSQIDGELVFLEPFQQKI